MNTLACLTGAQLRDFDQGLCSQELCTQISQHLDGCPECAARFQNLPTVTDPLLERLRQPLPQDVLLDDPESVECVRRTLAAAGTVAVSGEETFVAETPSAEAAVLNSLIERLGPPQSSEELGYLGRYRVMALLGHGGMGAVFRAEDPQLRRVVALKVMKPSNTTAGKERRRFLREAQAVAAVQHDNVVTIYEVGEDRGLLFLVMPLLQGETLGNRLRRQSKLDPVEALRIAREAAAGLAAAHVRGLVHRDVKPDNLWLESTTGRVKLLDFGLARPVDAPQPLTQAGFIVGTLNYLSPEQVLGEPVDLRSDFFSLGVVLYEMLTSERPFQRPNLLATLSAIGSALPRELNADIPRDIAMLVQRLLEKKPENRFARTEDVIAAIDHCQRQANLETASGNEGPPSVDPPLQLGSVEPPKIGRRIGMGMAALLLAVVIITIRDKDGNVISRLFAPGDSTVSIEKPVDESDVDPVKVPQAPGIVAPDLDKEHLPPMGPMALVQKPPQLVAKDGDAVLSWTLLPVGTPIVSVLALSADGSLLATFGDDGVVRVWDVDQQKLHSVLIGHTAGPCTPAGKPIHPDPNRGYGQTHSRRFGPIVWCPSGDGQSTRLASASRDGVVRVWDVTQGSTLWTEVRGSDRLNMIAWSPDGGKLAIGDDDGQVDLRDALTGKELGALSFAEGPITGLSWSQDSRWLAIHAMMPHTGIGVVSLWEISTGKQQRLESALLGGSAVVANLAHGISPMRWSPTGKQLAVMARDGLRIHGTTDWKQAHRLKSGVNAPTVIQDFDWSPDGTRVLVSWGGHLWLHDVNSDSAQPIPLKDTQRVLKIEWAPGTTRALVWIADGPHTYSRLVDTGIGEVIEIADGINHIFEFTVDGKRLLARAGNSAAVIDLTDEPITWRPPATQHEGTSNPQEVIWSTDGAAANLYGIFWIDAITLHTWNAPFRNFVNWSPDGNRALLSDYNAAKYEFWSIKERRQLAALELPNARVWALDFSPDGSEIAAGGHDEYKGDILILDGATGTEKRRMKIQDVTGKYWSTRALTWSHRGDRLAMARDIDSDLEHPRFRVFVVDSKTDQLVSQLAAENLPDLRHVRPGQGLLWSPDDRKLLVCGATGFSIYKSATGQHEKSFTLQFNQETIRFQDDDHVLYGTVDGSLCRLNVTTGHREPLVEGLGNVIGIAPHGQFLASESGAIRIHRGDGELLFSVFPLHDPWQPWVVSPNGHFWNNEPAEGPFWATVGTVPSSLVYVVQTAAGQRTLTPIEFATRYGWRNDPHRVPLNCAVSP